MVFSLLAFAGCGDEKEPDNTNQSDKDSGITPPTGDQGNQGNQSSNPPAPHIHVYDLGKVGKEATCKEEGQMVYTCSCGNTKTEAIAKKTEHTFDSGVVSGTTKTYTCTVCGETKTEAVADPNQGNQGNQGTDTPTPPPAPHTHSWGSGKVTKEATCKEEGTKTYTCSCGETKTEAIAKKTEHNFDSGVIGTDKITYTCSVCGETKTENRDPSHEHKWGDPQITKAATCGEDGEVLFKCSCGLTVTGPVSATGKHTFNIQGICTVCGDIMGTVSPSDIG